MAQTEGAISLQTGGEDERMTRLGLMRMELEGEVKELEAQLEAKRGALREVSEGAGLWNLTESWRGGHGGSHRRARLDPPEA